MADSEHFFNIHTHSSRFPSTEIIQLECQIGEMLPPYFSVGVHPKEVLITTIETLNIEDFIDQSGFLAIGEIGLDNRYANFGEIQEAGYIAQLQLAEKLEKPVILHCVNSWDRCRFLHQTHAPSTYLIYHGFNKASIAHHVLAYDKAVFSIGSGILSNPQLQEAVKSVPIDRLLAETDTSDIGIEEIYQKLAELKSLDLPRFSSQIEANIKEIFGV